MKLSELHAIHGFPFKATRVGSGLFYLFEAKLSNGFYVAVYGENYQSAYTDYFIDWEYVAPPKPKPPKLLAYSRGNSMCWEIPSLTTPDPSTHTRRPEYDLEPSDSIEPRGEE